MPRTCDRSDREEAFRQTVNRTTRSLSFPARELNCSAAFPMTTLHRNVFQPLATEWPSHATRLS